MKMFLVKLSAVCGTLVLVLLVAINIAQIIKTNALRSKSSMLDAKISELQDQKAHLEETAKNHTSDTYVEDYARSNLDMIEDGDIIIVIK